MKIPTEPYAWRNFADELPYGAVWHHREQLVLNRAAEQLTGYLTHEFQSVKDWMNKLYGEHSDKVELLYRHDKSKGFQKERITPITTKKGATRWVQFRGVLQGVHEVWLMRDVSDQNRVQVYKSDVVYEDVMQQIEAYTLELEQVINTLFSCREHIDGAKESPESLLYQLIKKQVIDLYHYLLHLTVNMEPEKLNNWAPKLNQCKDMLKLLKVDA